MTQFLKERGYWSDRFYHRVFNKTKYEFKKLLYIEDFNLRLVWPQAYVNLLIHDLKDHTFMSKYLKK